MLTRRSVRIKTMQAIFAAHFDQSLSTQQLTVLLEKNFNKVYQLHDFLLHLLIKIGETTESEKERRQAKHLPTDEDLNFDDKLSKSKFISLLRKNQSFISRLEKNQLHILSEEDSIWVKKILSNTIKATYYEDYLKADKDDTQAESRLFLKILLKKMLDNDAFKEHLEERFPSFEDDKKVVIFSIKKIIEEYGTSGKLNFSATQSDFEEVEYGKKLLKVTIEQGQELKEIIEPKLVKWDWDRIAIIDAILLKMAVAELLHFPTIPVKVTINEYIDIAKIYSTPKSKDFINGLLDKIMNSLKSEKKIVKSGRGLQG